MNSIFNLERKMALNLGLTFVDLDDCPQCTWFVETNLPAGGADWPATASLTVNEETRTIDDGHGHPVPTLVTVFTLVNAPGSAPTRRMVPRKRQGGNLRGAVRLEFGSVTLSPVPRPVGIGTGTAGVNPIHTVQL
jgi:hypothetical protein